LTILKLAGAAGFRMCYCDGAEFIVGRGGGAVLAVPGTVPAGDLASYLLGPVLGFVLRLRGVTCLHASAVAIGGCAIAFLGPPGAGKSTTAAALGRLGHPVLTDDLAALTDQGDRFLVQPGFAWLRLRPASAGLLREASSSGPRLTPTTDSQYLDLDLGQPGYLFQRAPLPLAAVYLLDERRDEPPAADGIAGADGLLALVANTWATTVLDGVLRAEELQQLARLARAVPLRRVRPSADPAYLPHLCDMIIADTRDRPASSPGEVPPHAA
jgi:hypothetical protein